MQEVSKRTGFSLHISKLDFTIENLKTLTNYIILEFMHYSETSSMKIQKKENTIHMLNFDSSSIRKTFHSSKSNGTPLKKQKFKFSKRISFKLKEEI
jgi:hypothetical protein